MASALPEGHPRQPEAESVEPLEPGQKQQLATTNNAQGESQIQAVVGANVATLDDVSSVPELSLSFIDVPDSLERKI